MGSTVTIAARRLYKQIRKGSRQRVPSASSVDTQEYDALAIAAEITYD